MIYDDEHKDWEKDFAQGIGTAFDAAKIDLLEAQIYRGKTDSETVTSFLDFCNRYVKWIPHTTSARDEPLWMLSVFYFVFDQKGIVEKQSKITPEQIGNSTELSKWLRKYANSLGEWMDTKASAQLISTFRERAEYTVFEYEDTNWKTFNEFFSRKVKPEYRPISPKNTVASPCDAKFDGFWEIKNGKVNLPNKTVNFKGIDWPIEKLLNDTGDTRKMFDNGIFMHGFLLTNNYHRVHAPVSGKVVDRQKIPGNVYLEVTADKKNQVLLPPPRRIQPRGDSIPDDVKAQDYAGYQWNQVRGMWIIDTTGSGDIDIGHVALFAVGMAQVSSVNWGKDTPGAPGTQVKKGEELGWLKYGGSDYILLFEKDKVHFDENCPQKGTLYLQGTALVSAQKT